jgi:hypothetical protein
MNPSIAIPAVATISAAIIAAVIVLFSKRIERRNEVESRHSAAREAAYDRLIAAGDAAWFYRTGKAIDPKFADRADIAGVPEAANSLFQSGLDRLKDHSGNFEAQLPIVSAWQRAAFDDEVGIAHTFESLRDAMVTLRRREIGLRKGIRRRRELSFYERLRSGDDPQRLPEGISQVMRTTDKEIIIAGEGEGFVQALRDSVRAMSELENSHVRAGIRLSDWRERGVWKAAADG